MSEIGVSYADSQKYPTDYIREEKAYGKKDGSYSRRDLKDSFETKKESKFPSAGQFITAGATVVGFGGSIRKGAEALGNGACKCFEWCGKQFGKTVKVPPKFKGCVTIGAFAAGTAAIFGAALKDSDNDGKSDILEAIVKFFKPGD